MANKIATYGDISSITGFTVPSSYNTKECPTKSEILSLLTSGYTLALDDYDSNQLVPTIMLTPSFDYSYFRITCTLPVSGTISSRYACLSQTSAFSGTTMNEWDVFCDNNKSLLISSYSGNQFDVKITSGKWNDGHSSIPWYINIILCINDVYYLYTIDIANKVGSSTWYYYMDDSSMWEYGGFTPCVVSGAITYTKTVNPY